ncbi:IMPACT family protein [Luteimonas mephitis]|uniref:IMPACT family protein n=1 Tax=Luteimonas mephitis TaxID=83615 RepID=UPI0004225B24|nr:YigZ family protein [Luteimonas mephitis]
MSLHTLAAPATHAIEVRHSRFVANAFPVESAEQAMHALAAASVADATHNCWAWRIGEDYRSNDDGEPAGTAGRPILAAIDGQGIDRVVVVVTRWFGGIKLGAGGLVRAYGGAAAECLRLAERVALVAMRDIALHAPFEDLGSVHAAFAAFSAEKLAETFDPHGVRLTLRLPEDSVDALKLRLRDATRNRVRFDDNG